jgi:hypothetical protein
MKVVSMKRVSVVIVGSFIMLASCSKNNEINSTEVENVSSESLSEACVAEASEMSTVILSSVNDSKLGSTPASIPDVSLIDSLLTGASIAIAGTGGMNNPQGTITIDFTKTGKKDPRGVTRKGIIKISYSGRRWAEKSSHSISFSGYSRNNVKIDDNTNYTITNLTANSDSTATRRNFQHVLKNCTLTFPDQKTFSREAKFIARINFVSKTTKLYAIDTCATGITRYGEKFVVFIIDSLVYKPQCIGAKIYLPNEGIKSLTVESSKYAVIYGSTLTCSQSVMVNMRDRSAAITVNSDGN